MRFTPSINSCRHCARTVRTLQAQNVPATEGAAGRRRRRDQRTHARHDPGKLNEVDALLKKFAGREAQLLQAVTAKYCPDDVDRFARIVKLFSEDADVNRMLRGFDEDATAKGIDKRRLIMFKCPTVDTLVILGDKQNLMKRMSGGGVELDMPTCLLSSCGPWSRPSSRRRATTPSLPDDPRTDGVGFDPEEVEHVAARLRAERGQPRLVRPMLVPRLA